MGPGPPQLIFITKRMGLLEAGGACPLTFCPTSLKTGLLRMEVITVSKAAPVKESLACPRSGVVKIPRQHPQARAWIHVQPAVICRQTRGVR